MVLNYNDSKGLYELDVKNANLTEEKIVNAGLVIVDKCEDHFLVEYKEQVYDINVHNGLITHHRSINQCCGTLYYGFGYLYEIKKLLQ